MKNLRLASVMLLASCALTPVQQNTVSALEKTGFDAGIGYLTGGTPGAITAAAPDAIATLQAATYGLRSTENPSLKVVPSTGAIVGAMNIAAGTGNVTPKMVTPIVVAIRDATASGTPPSVAIEKVALGLDKAATTATPKPSVSASVARGLIRLAATPYTVVPLEDLLFPTPVK